MRILDNFGQNYIPLRLPCGKEINQHYGPGKVLQCCRTECPDKSNEAIELCYGLHKQRLITERERKVEEIKKVRDRKTSGVSRAAKKEKGAA